MHEALDTRPNVALTVEQLLATSRTFSSLVRAHTRKIASDAEVRQRDVETILQDSIDIVLQEAASLQAEDGVPPLVQATLVRPRMANVAIHVQFEDDSDLEDDDEIMITYMHTDESVSPRGMMPAGLPLVNIPKEQYRIYAILDEGCNSSCHTSDWADHAGGVYYKMGLMIGDLYGPVKSYAGIGSAKTRGKRKIPIAIELLQPKNPRDRVVQGEVSSNELNVPGFYMLLSLHAQGTLGMVKDVAAGTCFMKDQQACCQLYEVKGSKLRAICINDFAPDDLRKLPLRMLPGHAPFRKNRLEAEATYPENGKESSVARNERLMRAVDSRGRKVMQPGTSRPHVVVKEEDLSPEEEDELSPERYDRTETPSHCRDSPGRDSPERSDTQSASPDWKDKEFMAKEHKRQKQLKMEKSIEALSPSEINQSEDDWTGEEIRV